MATRKKTDYLIQSVDNALELLAEMAAGDVEIGVTDLATKLGLHKNNIFRLLATLELRGFVEQNPLTENYRLGVRNLQLGQSYLAANPLVTRALPIIKNLSEKTGETCSLAILIGRETHFPIALESKRVVRVASRNGQVIPAKQNLAGRLLLASLPEDLFKEVMNDSGNSPQDIGLKTQAPEMRRTGFAIDKGGIEGDVVSMAKVVKGYKDQVVAALELLAPQFRAKNESLQNLLVEAANELSRVLGASKISLSSTIEKEIILNAKGGVSSKSASTTDTDDSRVGDSLPVNTR
ncbi:MAG TPA: IclR family transcriptional regulator [Oligoflexia bacterium]|nr:IclR family transcriptional regulator [Oligoflexia bacterium]HMP27058.1 IclR family transcriptional regulator [Oligoflexia bacterium]